LSVSLILDGVDDIFIKSVKILIEALLVKLILLFLLETFLKFNILNKEVIKLPKRCNPHQDKILEYFCKVSLQKEFELHKLKETIQHFLRLCKKVLDQEVVLKLSNQFLFAII